MASTRVMTKEIESREEYNNLTHFGELKLRINVYAFPFYDVFPIRPNSHTFLLASSS